MDLISSAYSNSDDDQAEPETKRPRPGNPGPLTNHRPKLQPGNEHGRLTEAPVPGRYVSKRERALMSSLAAPAPEPKLERDPPGSTGSFSSCVSLFFFSFNLLGKNIDVNGVLCFLYFFFMCLDVPLLGG